MDLQLLPWCEAFFVGQGEAFGGVDAQRQEVEVEERPFAVPDGRMLVAGDDPPRAGGLDELRQTEVEVDQPVAGRVLHVPPVAWLRPLVIPAPVAGLEIAG